MQKKETVSISLHEAIPLLSHLKKELYAEKRLRRERAVDIFPKDGFHGTSEDVDELTERIDNLRHAIHLLSMKIAEANRTTNVDFSFYGKDKLTIADAINLARQLHDEIDELAFLASRPKQPQPHRNHFSNETLYERATFDVDKYRAKADQLRRLANRLSLEIDRANFSTFILINRETEFDPYLLVEL